MSDRSRRSSRIDGTPVSTEQPINVAFDALSHQYRRQVVASLSVETPSSVVEVAKEIADTTQNVDVKEVAASLHHSHLPKLTDAGFITYQSEDNTIVLSEQGEQVRQLSLLDTQG